ncbi:DUF6263 family protein [Candidatus Sulfidibacterium hydrothermale]|uniref:DUF6263 family protein n=1 Tax=Candidatus Sulfidibacterium hydrothermale TaxID=2875962 RepID=UPI001F0A4F2A|nr:DUF6263 family protein [Candidatus Sulfidibacterium hydrothermale]UBM61455.1 DUF6263 family protein [Candidatus Sulfidibacterium hydrothermale]
MKNFKLILALAIVLPVFSYGQKKVFLKYNLKKGETFITHTSTNQDITITAQGQTMNMNQVISSDITTKVEKVSADSIVTSNTMDKMTMDQTMFGQELKYDSSDPSTYASGRGKQIGEALNKLIGKAYKITMDHSGNIGSYDISELINEGGKVSSNLKSSNNYIVFPKHKIKVGDTWEADIRPMKTDNMKIHMKYTLKKLSGKKATISVSGTITANEIDGQTLNLSGTQSGTIVINTKTGWPISAHLTQDIKMKLEKNGMEIPMEISSTINSTSQKK